MFKLAENSIYAFTKGIPGRISMQSGFDRMRGINGGGRDLYPHLAQQVEKIGMQSLHSVAGDLRSQRTGEMKLSNGQRLLGKVASAKALTSDRRSEAAGLARYRSSPLKAYGSLVSPALVRAQQEKFGSDATKKSCLGMNGRPGTPSTQDSALSRAPADVVSEESVNPLVRLPDLTSPRLLMNAMAEMKARNQLGILTMGKIYRESIDRATHVLMSLEKEKQAVDKDMALVDKYFADPSQKSKTEQALHHTYLVPLAHHAEKQVFDLSKKIKDILDCQSLTDKQKGAARAYANTAEKHFCNILARIEKIKTTATVMSFDRI